MLETILFIVVGSIVISVVQSIRRGDATDEERQKKTTIIETASEAAEGFARYADKYRLEKEFERNYCRWFRRFESTVSASLRLAEAKTERDELLKLCIILCTVSIVTPRSRQPRA